jgi:hypothetical protein
VTITGMIFSSAFAIFLVPVLFVLVERISNRFRSTRRETSPPPEDQQAEKPAA